MDRYSVLLGAALLVASRAAESATMIAHMIDVGQGAATLLEFPCGAVLIDTGGEKNSQFNSREKLTTYLDAFFDRRQDLNRTLGFVLLSHPHDDHIRGVDELLDEDNEFTIGGVIDNGDRPAYPFNNQRQLQNFAQPLTRYVGIKVSNIPADGFAGGILDPFDCSDVDPEFRVLWGTTESQPTDWSTAEFKNPNNHSVVLRVDFGHASFLFLGDLEVEGERGLLAKFHGTPLLDVDVLQVSHHGAENGTSQALLSATTPRRILVPVGDPARHVMSKSAFSHGHARKDAMVRFERDIPTLSLRASPVEVEVATAPKQFEGLTVTKAIYGTGWDHDVILVAHSNGVISFVVH